MKHYLNLTATLLILSLNCFSQEKTYPTPDYDNAPFYYNLQTNQLTELEAIQYTIGSRPKGAFGAESALYIEGKTSVMKINKDSANFIVKLKAGVDPRTLMDLDRTKVNENSGKREYLIYKKGAFTGESVNQPIELGFKKIGEGIYLVTPKATLTSGEYFFSLLENTKSKIVYCFSIN